MIYPENPGGCSHVATTVATNIELPIETTIDNHMFGFCPATSIITLSSRTIEGEKCIYFQLLIG